MLGKRVMFNSLFFYNDHENIFGMCNLRDAFKEALARSLGFLNGRTLEGVEKLDETSKTCSKRVEGLNRCGNKARYRLIMMYEEKYFSVYLCEQHLKEEIRNARNKIVSSVDCLIEHLEKELGD